MIKDWINIGINGAYWFMDPARISTLLVSSAIIVYACFRSLKTENETGDASRDSKEKKCGEGGASCNGNKLFDQWQRSSANTTSPNRQPNAVSTEGTFAERQADDGFQVLDSTQAILLPLGASVTLLLMFYFFDSMQIVLTLCTAGIACVSFAYLLLPCCKYCLRSTSESLPLRRFPIKALCQYTLAQVCSLVISLVFVLLWIVTGHWILMDALGLGLCVSFISYVKLPSLKVSIMLLLGLVVYDVFWVFFSSYIFKTNVMLRVATNAADNPVLVMAKKLHSVSHQFSYGDKSGGATFNYVPPPYPWKVVRGGIDKSAAPRTVSLFSAPKLSLPVKLLFPSSQESGHFSMLGLGDIVMPGLLLCFLLRFDWHKKSQSDDDREGQNSSSSTSSASTIQPLTSLDCRDVMSTRSLTSPVTTHYYHHDIGCDPSKSRRRSKNIDKCVTRFRFRRMSYFHCSLIGYFLGLICATLSSEIFKAAQPALLYLVPFTLIPILVMAHIKGDLMNMWNEPFNVSHPKVLLQPMEEDQQKLLEVI